MVAALDPAPSTRFRQAPTVTEEQVARLRALVDQLRPEDATRVQAYYYPELADALAIELFGLGVMAVLDLDYAHVVHDWRAEARFDQVRRLGQLRREQLQTARAQRVRHREEIRVRRQLVASEAVAP